MPSLPRGLYETLVDEALAERLEQLHGTHRAGRTELRNAEAADRIALHVSRVVERALEMVPEERRAEVGVPLARTLIEGVVDRLGLEALLADRPVEPGEILRSVTAVRPDGTPAPIEGPLIPLLDSALLTNAPGEPSVGHQIAAEIASADRIDLVMAFIRRTGIRPLRDKLRAHVEEGGSLRVLTTTYTGSTEALALEWLEELGAELRVSYDTSTTRLHAKAWIFHRDSGFSTAYVGSSNLTYSAQVSGLEWNVRISSARNRSIIEKVAAVFDSYWEQPDFEAFDRERFRKDGERRERQQLVIAPVEIRLEPFQARLLEQIELSRERGWHRNLLASATGTGKTVMAAVDYRRLRTTLPRTRLLFVAHREEILTQARATFAQALQDASFGELWVGGRRPTEYKHVFASIQSLASAGLDDLAPDHFDVVVVDEFHHAAADSYQALLDHVKPLELLGLTATPERSDGLPVLHWFDDRIAAEFRLWDAIDQHRLAPFAYFGIADELDLREVPWRRGTGYETGALTNLITSTDVWAKYVLNQFLEYFGNPPEVRALGFCVGVEHALYMARVFEDYGVRASAVLGTTGDEERRRALEDLASGKLNVVFSVDLFNEGVDVPSVDALLMLRPTESPVLFLQQLGRGLRKAEGKTVCTVLDFVGHHRKEFRYDRRFRALLGGSRMEVARQIEQGFPFLPAGCHMQLDRVAEERVLSSVRNALPSNIVQRAAELSDLASKRGEVDLGTYLRETGLDLDDVYSGNYSWSGLRERAGLPTAAEGPHEKTLRRVCGRLLHVDDLARLNAWRGWLKGAAPPDVDPSGEDGRAFRMLVTQLLHQVSVGDADLTSGGRLLWEHPQVRSELVQLFDVLSDRLSHVTKPLDVLPDVPLRVHARYTRLEILAACGAGEGARVPTWREGVRYEEDLPADLLAFTLDKTDGQFSPTTRYRDYAVSRELIHWESQSLTPQDSETGLRYQEHASRGSHILLFARLNTSERAFHFLGPATYVGHTGEKPMAITWRLEHPLPGDLFQEFAAAVA